MKREMQRRTSAFHGQRSKIACFSCFFYDSLRQSSGLFRESLDDDGSQLRDRRVMRNAEKVIQFEQAMFDWRSRHLILVLTLGYRSDFQQFVTLDTIRQHRDRLLNNRRSNQLLAEINGYVWKIEEGCGGGGLHLHLVLFYSGDHRCDIHFAERIGEYWVNVITEGGGSYWNSNANWRRHAMYGHGIGTGQIDRHDHEKREALRKNLLYVAKGEQRVAKGDNSRLRMFGTSMHP